MNQIVVRKQKSHRMGIRFLFLLDCLAFCILLWVVRDYRPGLLMFVLTQLPMMGLLVYFETWSIVFRQNEIRKSCWGRQRGYAWTEVREAVSCRSATEGPYILIRFRDGKHFRFRLEDENGAGAVGLIMKHTSIVSR